MISWHVLFSIAHARKQPFAIYPIYPAFWTLLEASQNMP
jgi:hypothetical protein